MKESLPFLLLIGLISFFLCLGGISALTLKVQTKKRRLKLLSV